MKEPKTPKEYQAAADAAGFALALAQAKSYGLVDARGVVDMARALDLQARCRALGYVPRIEAIEGFIHALARNQGGTRSGAR